LSLPLLKDYTQDQKREGGGGKKKKGRAGRGKEGGDKSGNFFIFDKKGRALSAKTPNSP